MAEKLHRRPSWWTWSNRIWVLASDLNLPIVPNPFYPYGLTSETGKQVYDGDQLHIHPDLTANEDLLHELAHHCECAANRPNSLNQWNWGLEDSDADARERAESTTCDIEIGIRVLWRWPWHQRAWDLNLPDWWPTDAFIHGNTWGTPRWAFMGTKLGAMAQEAMETALQVSSPSVAEIDAGTQQNS